MTNWFIYCPNCGKRINSGRTSNSQTCSGCKLTFYHNPTPTVGAIIIKKNQVLLGKRRHKPFKNYWDIPGGFINPGEHPYDALQREVKEELGINVKVIKLTDFFPDFYGEKHGKNTVNIHFLCEVSNQGKIKPGTDVVEIQWFPIDDLPGKIAFNHGRKSLELAIELYKQRVGRTAKLNP